MKLFHKLSYTKTLCKHNLSWKRNTLCCDVCGEPAGFRWLDHECISVYLFPKFKDMRGVIENRRDTYQITVPSDLLGMVTFKDFDQFIESIRKRNSLIKCGG